MPWNGYSLGANVRHGSRSDSHKRAFGTIDEIFVNFPKRGGQNLSNSIE